MKMLPLRLQELSLGLAQHFRGNSTSGPRAHTPCIQGFLVVALVALGLFLGPRQGALTAGLLTGRGESQFQPPRSGRGVLGVSSGCSGVLWVWPCELRGQIWYVSFSVRFYSCLDLNTFGEVDVSECRVNSLLD